VKEGIFKELCRTAYNTLLTLANIDKRWNEDQDVPHLTDEETQYALSLAPKVPFYLVIDEINRGDISRIFGELITLLEKDKRLLAPHEITTKLPSSRTRFGIPPNLFLIGTMNTADKSIALIDIALRRRFGFIEMMPDYDLLYRTLSSDDESLLEVYSIAIALLRTINQRILEEHDREHQIGHSFLLKLKDARTRDQAIAELSMIWYHEIIPLLHEYFYDAPRKLFKVVGPEFMKSDPKCIHFYPEKEGESFLFACKSISKGYDLNGISSTDAL
jgi:5-methylcytosine-specific restriction protein B